MSPLTIVDPDTPFAVLDHNKLLHNIQRMQQHIERLGVTLRPHLKTAKSVDVASRLFNGATGPITVSTLAEAEAFAAAGYTDIVYAVGIAPHKLPRVLALCARGVDLTVLLDSREQAEAVAKASREAGKRIPALIEIDCDGHRGGVLADDPALIEIGRILDSASELRGVLTHAGESYFANTQQALAAAAENERIVAVTAANALRSRGLPCPVVSVGSTPTAYAAVDLTGVTEVRAGNYMFFDLFMAGVGVCDIDDLALSVVVTVIGHRPGKGWIITDGGWMATSSDRGTASQRIDQGYGMVTALDGVPYTDLIMSHANQEHGILTIRPNSSARLPVLPLGTRVRILPNHACATAAQYDQYHVIHLSPGLEDTGPATIDALWPRVNRW
ncbi:DSD1 family PLP-dependent enzyme [Ktedonosporobacter rubrisoli]|uniref:DSD1 family PLP-dependent enzyme n=1 Tax=Ktedonosporobacter rubrisoli TaxID=2509675 RepID=A0A4V0YY79_KTERU|nr:DSD1 family PLP-dependent enzyme [Ktedonosporobacter rubrisoli]QBD75281.1 DSD1 family PLP-dependent enzyme [Ktedonosporobacter rubrisoli]